MPARRLLKSCASPPVSWPTTSIFCAWCSAASACSRSASASATRASSVSFNWRSATSAASSAVTSRNSTATWRFFAGPMRKAETSSCRLVATSSRWKRIGAPLRSTPAVELDPALGLVGHHLADFLADDIGDAGVALIGGISLDMDVVAERSMRPIEELDDAKTLFHGLEESPVALPTAWHFSRVPQYFHPAERAKLRTGCTVRPT